MLVAFTLKVQFSVSLLNTTLAFTPLRRSRYRSYRASSPDADVNRPPMSTDPFDGGVVCCCGLPCADATVAEASKSAAVPIISLLRIAIILLT